MEKAKLLLRNILSSNSSTYIKKSRLLELQHTIEAYDEDDIQDVYDLLIGQIAGKEEVVAKTIGSTRTIVEKKIKNKDFTAAEMKLLAIKFLLDGVNSHAQV